MRAFQPRSRNVRLCREADVALKFDPRQVRSRSARGGRRLVPLFEPPSTAETRTQTHRVTSPELLKRD